MFVNREKEISRLNISLVREKPQLVVIYGRRRCGKSTLLQYALPDSAIYYVADLREAPLQIAAFASRTEKAVPGFSKAVYPDWESLFISLNNSLKNRTIICIDEFPYLVRNSPELPSVLQNIADSGDRKNYHLILCGSSQQMMHNMVLESGSPLYGRCDEIIRIKPMNIGNMQEFLSVSPEESVKEFGVWGGVPRYWEIRRQFKRFDEAVKYGILDQNSILYEEPERLFIDEMRTSVFAFSILSLIGAGVHRPSEIAARLGKPATQLARPLAFLVNQGYIRRETPFGEHPGRTKRSFYRIDDPFLNFYFTFLVPNRSRLEFDMVERVWQEVEKRYDLYISWIWEDLCRKVVPYIEIEGHRFNPALRWWGTGVDRDMMEMDVVALSVDNSALLIGEAKWTDKDVSAEINGSLKQKEANLPFRRPEKVYRVLFQKRKAFVSELTVFTPDDVLSYSK